MKLLKILLVSMFLMSVAACGDDDEPTPPDAGGAPDVAGGPDADLGPDANPGP